MTNRPESSFSDAEHAPLGYGTLEFAEVDVSRFSLGHFAKPWETGTSGESLEQRIDARHSKVEELLYAHGISPLHVERLNETTLAVQAPDTSVELIIERVIRLLHIDLESSERR